MNSTHKNATIRRRRQNKTARVLCRMKRPQCTSGSAPCEACKQHGKDKRPRGHRPEDNRSSPASDQLPESRDTASIGSVVNGASDLSQASSVVPSNTYESRDLDPAPKRVLFPKPIHALPSWSIIDHLFEPYFPPVLARIGFPCDRFDREYRKTRRGLRDISLSWLSVLFTVMSWACRLAQRPVRMALLKRLSLKYENAASACLVLEDRPTNLTDIARNALIRNIFDRINP